VVTLELLMFCFNKSWILHDIYEALVYAMCGVRDAIYVKIFSSFNLQFNAEYKLNTNKFTENYINACFKFIDMSRAMTKPT
jgi:hypothetical protein